MLYSGEPKKDEGHILVVVKASFNAATMSFAVGFDLRLAHNSMAPKELSPMRVV